MHQAPPRVIFLSPDWSNAFTSGAIISPTDQWGSYMIEYQSKQYLRTRHHIYALDDTTNTPTARPWAYQCPATPTPITRPETQSKAAIAIPIPQSCKSMQTLNIPRPQTPLAKKKPIPGPSTCTTPITRKWYFIHLVTIKSHPQYAVSQPIHHIQTSFPAKIRLPIKTVILCTVNAAHTIPSHLQTETMIMTLHPIKSEWQAAISSHTHQLWWNSAHMKAWLPTGMNFQ